MTAVCYKFNSNYASAKFIKIIKDLPKFIDRSLMPHFWTTVYLA